MISTCSPEPQVNFWQQLVMKVQEIQRRTGQEAPRPMPREQSIRKKRFSRFQVEESWHRSQREAQSLANRIKYINAEQARHSRTLHLARQKYERMMAIRERSLRDKDDCRKRISQINEEISKEVESKVTRTREERFRVTQSVQRVREKNQSDAHGIRQLSSEIDKVLQQEREMEVQEKKEKVETARESMERSRMRLSQMQQNRVRLGKVEHKETIRKQLTMNLHQHRRNSLLRQKLEESIITAENSKNETLSRLREYQTIMTPSTKRPSSHTTALTIS